MPLFNYNEMQQLVAEVGHPEKVIIIISQLPGMLVHVPEGWVHAIANVRHCFKIAIDLCNQDRFHLYGLSQAMIAAGFTRWSNKDEYMGCTTIDCCIQHAYGRAQGCPCGASVAVIETRNYLVEQ
jgi:hypothetical protein